MSEKPNIVYIFSDQHRGDSMGCAGHPAVISPNLDQIASEGVRFSRCSSNSPLCMPARATMMSGQYVCEHGVWDNNRVADPNGPSHVRNIRDAGYHTGLIGKTHLYRHEPKERGKRNRTEDHVQTLNEWGFDYVHELTGPIATLSNDSAYTEYLAENGLLEKHREFMTEYVVAWRKGQIRPWEEPPCPLPPEAHLDAYTGRKAAEWINEYDGDKPFYLQVLFPGPHDPFDSPAKYREMYNPDDMPVGNMEWPDEPIPPYMQMVLNWSNLKSMTPEHKQLLRTFYYAKITMIDEYIGMIYDALEDRGMLDNTWIVYNSDHGEMLGDHMMSHKIVFYEQALNIPCIMRPPKGNAGWRSRALTDQIDVAASLIDMAGAKSLEGSDGQSLVPLVEAGAGASGAHTGKDAVFSEVYGYSMVRDERYKLVVRSESLVPVEMYDLEKDPDELMNLALDPELEEVRLELTANYLTNLLDRIDNDKYDKFADSVRAAFQAGRGPGFARDVELLPLDEETE